jgi:hypothetical protein
MSALTIVKHLLRAGPESSTVLGDAVIAPLAII